jgi:hypothetical protein
MSGINTALDWLIDLMGGPSYTQGRYTYEGAYAYAGAGGGTSIDTGGVHIHGDLEVSGYHDGEEAGAAIIEEITRYEEIATRAVARNFKQAMIKREAQER